MSSTDCACRLGSVPQADVAAYHRHHYRPTNMVVSAAGNLDDDAITRFSELLVGDSAEAPLEGISRAESGSPTLSLMVKPTEQVHLCLGGPGLGLCQLGQLDPIKTNR